MIDTGHHHKVRTCGYCFGHGLQTVRVSERKTLTSSDTGTTFVSDITYRIKQDAYDNNILSLSSFKRSRPVLSFYNNEFCISV